MKYIVYCTINLINNKIYIGVHQIANEIFDGYIGCGIYVNKPSTYSHPKTHFQYAVKKYGPKNFKRIILKEFDNEEDAYDLESQLVNIEFLKRKDVYNMVVGGLGGDLANNSKPCYQYDLEGNFIAKYESQQKAAIAVNRCFSVIKSAIRDKVQSANYFWTDKYYKKLELSDFKTSNNKIMVFQYSEKGEYDCCYESVSDAARVNNVSTTNIHRACTLGYKVKNKYFSYTFYSFYNKNTPLVIRGRKVYQYTLSGEFVAEYNNCQQAEQAIHAKRGLSTAIKLGRTFHGFQWKLEKMDRIDSIEINVKPRRVGQYDLKGNLIKVYNTVTECTKDFSGCRHVLHGTRKTSGGYVFKYIE